MAGGSHSMQVWIRFRDIGPATTSQTFRKCLLVSTTLQPLNYSNKQWTKMKHSNVLRRTAAFHL